MELHILALLMIKHAVADLFLQSYHKNINKIKYISNAHKHYLDHGILTFLVVIFFVPFQFALLVAILDYVAHWHIDHLKSRLVQYFEIDRDSTVFWRIQAADQALHYLTYYLIVFSYQQFKSHLGQAVRRLSHDSKRWLGYVS